MTDTAPDVAVIRGEMGIDREELDRRKAWLRLDEEDAALLRGMGELIDPHVGAIVEALTDELGINGAVTIEPKHRQLLRDYFSGLLGGDGFGDSFVDRRLAMVDTLHESFDPDVSWYLAAYLFYLQAVSKRLREATGEPAQMQALQRAFAKLMSLDLSLAIDSYLFERDRTIRSQQRELEELSTPVLQLREGLLISPIIGMLDSRRAQQLTEQLLSAIRSRRAKVVVLDVTGVAAVDSRVANHLIQTVDAARLMGATAIVTGVSPEVAQTLVGLGISLNVTTVADLQGGIEAADRLLARDGEDAPR